MRFEIDTDLDKAGTCNCSICRRKNAVMHRVPADRFRLIRGEDALQLYTFNTGTDFCKTCGIYPFHRPRVAPDEYTVNVFCLEDFDDETLASLEKFQFDGRAFSTVA